MSNKSLQERLNFITEDDGACSTCSGGGGEGDAGGGGDFTSGAADGGPSAGFDKLLKGLKMIKKKKKSKSQPEV